MKKKSKDPMDKAIEKLEEDLWKEAVPIEMYTKEQVAEEIINLTAKRHNIDRVSLYALFEYDEIDETPSLNIYELPEEEKEYELGDGELFFGGKMKIKFEDAVVTADAKPYKNPNSWYAKCKQQTAVWKAQREIKKCDWYKKARLTGRMTKDQYDAL